MKMAIHVRVDAARLNHLIATMPAFVDGVLDGAIGEMKGEVVDSIEKSPPDPMKPTYRHRTRAKDDQPYKFYSSYDRNPPRKDSGELVRSFRVVSPYPNERRLQDGVDYGYAIEMGRSYEGRLYLTPPNPRIEPRPFMRPVWHRWGRGRLFERYVRARLARYLGGAI